ncbi:gamma-aminobutyric acid type B receptor subunit 1-like [Amphiura filiformis]|uniref:gamma-aminobutyric acid type B receptor subunit 1-like n=1 Tax=Amphiura filiformis TaxID=82378 RepID=UPI003B211164
MCTKNVDHLRDLLVKANISIITSETVADNPVNQILNLKEQDAKIIIMDVYGSKAAAILCEAYKIGITGEGYMWLLLGWYGKKWWHFQDGYHRCTKEEIKIAIESTFYLSTDMVQLRPSMETNIAGIVCINPF